MDREHSDLDDGNRANENFELTVNDIAKEKVAIENKREEVVVGEDPQRKQNEEISASGPTAFSRQEETVTSIPEIQSLTTSTENSSTQETVVPATTSSSVLENARLEVNQMIERNELDSDSISAIQTMFRDYEGMKDKVTKLKTLLGRSAKAQRDIKVEMDNLQKKYDALLSENTMYQQKIHKLQVAQKQQRQLHQAQQQRPSHMDVLADFETNFDRALLAMSGKQQQAGGQDTSGGGNNSFGSFEMTTPGTLLDQTNGAVTQSSATGNSVDQLLMQELSESKARIDKLEQMNTTFMQRCSQYEQQSTTYKHTIHDIQNKCSHYEVEKKMLTLQNDSLSKQLQSQQALIDEMQLEIELVTKQQQVLQYQQQQASTAVDTTNSSNTGSINDHLTTMKALQEQNKAYEEWALASNHAKTLAQNRIRMLEQQLASLSLDNDVSQRSTKSETGNAEPVSIPTSVGTITTMFDNASTNSMERLLENRSASIVIGAGDIGVCLFEISTEILKTVNTFTHRIVLRYTFDILPKGNTNTDIMFSIYKGNCKTSSERRTAATLIKDRIVKGGAGGELDQNDIFSVARSCTIVWSNEHSWIRPRTIKYNIEAIVLPD